MHNKVMGYISLHSSFVSCVLGGTNRWQVLQSSFCWHHFLERTLVKNADVIEGSQVLVQKSRYRSSSSLSSPHLSIQKEKHEHSSQDHLHIHYTLQGSAVSDVMVS